MSEVLSTEDKIQWLIDNEGTEIANGYCGLSTFFNYCCSEDHHAKILDLIEDDIHDYYIETKGILDAVADEEKDWRDSAVNGMADAVWSDLDGAGLLRETSSEVKEEILEKWKKELRVML